MSSLPIFVGLDYHQDSVQACVLDADGNQLSNCSLPNDADAIFKHCESIGTIQSVAIEACCGAANLADELTDKGWTMNLALQKGAAGYPKPRPTFSTMNIHNYPIFG